MESGRDICDYFFKKNVILEKASISGVKLSDFCC